VPKEYIARTVACQKAPLGLKQHQTVKKTLAQAVSQSGSQLEENSIKLFFFKFHGNFLKAFRVDLKGLSFT